MAFYVRGQPRTYCAGPYSVGKRLSQYDMWPDRRLDRTSLLVGQDAIYIGKGDGMPLEVIAAFDSVQRCEPLDIKAHGVIIHIFHFYRRHGFKGFNAIAPNSSSESF